MHLKRVLLFPEQYPGRDRIELIDILHDTGKAGHARFIIATHSPVIPS